LDVAPWQNELRPDESVTPLPSERAQPASRSRVKCANVDRHATCSFARWASPLDVTKSPLVALP
jgi:hypothetical protein